MKVVYNGLALLSKWDGAARWAAVSKWTQRRDGGECIHRGWRGRRHYNVPFKYNEGGEDGLIALWDYPAKADRGEAERDERCNDRWCWQCKSPPHRIHIILSR